MTTQPSQKKRLEWWEFALLGLVPTFLGALSLAIYLLGKNWNRFLVDAVVSAGVLTFSLFTTMRKQESLKTPAKCNLA